MGYSFLDGSLLCRTGTNLSLHPAITNVMHLRSKIDPGNTKKNQAEDYREGIGLSIGLLPAAPSRFFVDIYEVGSGGRIVAIDGVDRDFIAGDAPLADSFWLESGHFVVPLGSTRQKLLVCEIPAM